MSTGWECLIISEGGNVELEQLDDGGEDWYASGPGGDHVGLLAQVLSMAASGAVDPDWLTVVASTIQRELGSTRRSILLAKRATGIWFHATFAENRRSITDYGLDWARMAGSGIAGSWAAESEGIFLCSDLEGADWFAQMGCRHGRRVDIWAVTLLGAWLVGDPGVSGGGDDSWMICPEPIASSQLRLIRRDIGLKA